MTTEVPVLIVGGGPTGLMTALLLARHGVPSLLVERHPGTSVLPRATVISVRSMEILRGLGLEAAVRRAAVDTDTADFLIMSRSLADEPLNIIPPIRSDSGDSSPTRTVHCAQDVLEPLLVARCGRESAAQLQFNTALTGFREVHDGVEATLEDRLTGAAGTVRARYLVAADGTRGIVRESAGIGLRGEAHLGRRLNILFRADVESAVRLRPAVLYRVVADRVDGMLRRADTGTRWLLSTTWAGEVTPELCLRLARQAIGCHELEIEILNVAEWEAAAMVADSFRAGRVLLAGDAAHRTTPAGGLGMNLGVQEAHNLAWKLAAVVRGWAPAELLDSYDDERRPAARTVVGESLRLMTDGSRSVARTLGLALGLGYESGALVPDGTEPPLSADPVTDYAPCARPGRRAPHLWLDAARRRSTLDLAGDGFSLLTAATRFWQDAQTGGMPLALHPIDDPAWRDVYGVEPSGAVLVRPDGYVAARWREAPERAASALTAALEQTLRMAQPACSPR